VVYLDKQAVQFGQMGYAAAMSVAMFVVSVALAAAVFRWARGWVFYAGEEA
jgi:ABC-type sugar transport system permease subunit